MMCDFLKKQDKLLNEAVVSIWVSKKPWHALMVEFTAAPPAPSSACGGGGDDPTLVPS